MGQYSSSLKLIYEAQSFMMSIKESQEVLSPDIEICVNMITFVALWKLKKFSESGEFLEASANVLNKVIQGMVESKMSKNSSQNLYCLIVMSLAALKVVLENDVKSACLMCEDCKLQLETNSLCNKLLIEFVQRLSDKNMHEKDFLISDIYQKIMFVTTFMPLISSNTPLIKISELEEEKEKINSNEEIKSIKSYKIGQSKERLDSSRSSRKGVKSTPRSNYSIKPWWESNKIIEQPKKIPKIPKSRIEARFKSEPRPSKHPLSYEVKKQYKPGLLNRRLNKPYSKESFYTDLSKEKEFRDTQLDEKFNDKELMMFEFNPANELITGDFQVQLVPLSMFQTNPSSGKERPLANFNISRL